jgi:hypothetical protein
MIQTLGRKVIFGLSPTDCVEGLKSVLSEVDVSVITDECHHGSRHGSKSRYLLMSFVG